MKNLIIALLFTCFYNISFSQTSKEIVIIRVEYTAKKSGIESSLYCDIGVANTHSLYRALTNEENTVQIKDENDKIRVFTTEVDLMNYLFSLGYQLKSTFGTEIINAKYMNFILIKE